MSTAKRAMVAEGDPFQAIRYTRALEGLGYKVTEVHDGLNAKEAIERGAAQDVLVADLSLPLVDGFGLIEHLRKRMNNRHAFVAGLPVGKGGKRFDVLEPDLSR
jgi:CheY-like chemotaxis protein